MNPEFIKFLDKLSPAYLPVLWATMQVFAQRTKKMHCRSLKIKDGKL